MSNTLAYSFEELPLIIEAGFEAGLVNGHAEIAYHRDGDWSVGAIYLDGLRLRSKAERDTMRANGLTPALIDSKPVELDRDTSLFNTVLHRLEHEWFEKVQDAVNDEIAGDRERAADDAADMRRERMREAV